MKKNIKGGFETAQSQNGFGKKESVLSTTTDGRKFLPHQFGSKIELVSGLPKVLVTREAYEDMYCLVAETETEIGWLGTVTKIGNNFLIEKIYLLDQRVHETTCELSIDGQAGLAMKLIETDEYNSLRFWGHSHVNMATSPSGQDESQMFKFATDAGCEFFIRAILNKSGRIEFTILLASIGVVIRDASWELFEPTNEDRRQRWRTEIAEKVKRITFVQSFYPNQYGLNNFERVHDGGVENE